MPAPVKEFHEYIGTAPASAVTLSNYLVSPAVAFLKCVVNAKDAATMCQNQFNKTRDRKLTKPALENLQNINAGLLAAIMGNFETFQKYLFSDMFEYSIYLNKFDVKSFIQRLTKVSNHSEISIDLQRFAAYRDNSVGVGMILAENLKNWSAPGVVNQYFATFGLKDAHGQQRALFSSDSIANLSVLWQLRHSIVHTAATITLPDAQKVAKLNSFGGRIIALEPQFIYEVARKMHNLVKEGVGNLQAAYVNNLKGNVPADVRRKIDDVFKVSSSCSVWLR